jgi:clan AA aspartic protease (TIGR02281 family)
MQSSDPDRREPTGPIDAQAADSAEQPIGRFLPDRRELRTSLSIGVRAVIGMLVLAPVTWFVAFGSADRDVLGQDRVASASASPRIVVGQGGVASAQSRVLSGSCTVAQRTATELREAAARSVAAREFACAERLWTAYLELRPQDSYGLANLGIVLNRRDAHEQAVVQFAKAIEAGEGTYDLFAYYADSLAKLERIDEAIDWSYRALSVVPSLVDVRGHLAKLLVRRQRAHEALALLQAFDATSEAKGQPAYFTGQRIAIESGLRDNLSAQAATAALRLPMYEGHYFVPVTVGSARPAAFMVDTGASRTVMSKAMLDASKADYRTLDASVQMKTADGRKVRAQMVLLPSLRVGPFALENVQAVVCEGCVPLLGQATLSRFDLRSSRAQGVEFLTMVRRTAP